MPQLQFIAESIKRWQTKVEAQMAIGPETK
jgi:hypothetical protein